MLLTCTLLNPDAITLNELTALTQLSEDTVLETLTYLRRTGFLQGHHNSYRLHRTWQTVIRDAALCAEDTTLVSSISQHLNEVFSDLEAQRKNPQPYLTWLAHGAAFCKAIEPWIEPWLSQKTNVLASVSVTLHNIGTFYYFCLGQYQLAKNMLETALTLNKAHYGENHVNVAMTLHNLANAIGDLGDRKKQKALLEQALIIEKKHYGENHVEVVMTLENLANAIGALGDHQKQKALLEQALIINKNHYGENHLAVARTLANLSIAEINLKQFQNALSHSKRACDIMTNFYDTHPLRSWAQRVHQNNQNAASRTSGFFDNNRTHVPQSAPDEKFCLVM